MPSIPHFDPLRQGMWLVVDLVDDLTERTNDPEDQERLYELRGAAVDLIMKWARLEKALAHGAGRDTSSSS